MRKFSRLSPLLWESARFKELASDSERFAFLYLLSSKHHSVSGVFHLPDAYAAADLGWDIKQYLRARHALVAARLIQADENTQEVLIERWLKHCPPQNGKHLAGIEKEIGALESARLKAVAQESLRSTEQWRRKNGF
jgi:hypothetical protein